MQKWRKIMLKRLPYFFILSLTVLCIVAVPALPQVKGAVVQSQNYDAASNTVTLTIVNTSGKDITAYNISISETNANGQVNRHEMLCDYVGRLVLIKQVQGTADEAGIRKQFGDGLFHPGESRNEITGARGLTHFQAVIDVVAYADGTAEASNNDGLQRMLTHRKATLASRQLANETIEAALADPNDANPAATAATKLQQRITVWKAQPRTSLDIEPAEIKSIVDELQRMPASRKNRDAIGQYLSRREAEVTMLAPHAKLTVGGPQ
jgi:hypothetical protein